MVANHWQTRRTGRGSRVFLCHKAPPPQWPQIKMRPPPPATYEKSPFPINQFFSACAVSIHGLPWPAPSDGTDVPKAAECAYGVSVGEFRKTCHPRNVEVHEIREMCFQGQIICEDLESGTHEVSKSWTRGGLESWTLEASESRTRDGLESWTCEASMSRTRKGSKPWTCRATNFGNLWNSGVWWRTSLGVTVREDFLNKEIRELRRSKVQVVVSKSPGLACELVAGL
jgi:hypothetical protein